jgi:uncharacterized membrane protein YdbT with pleckstrin-like domain
MARSLMPGEQVLADTRQHWSVVAPALVAIGVIGVAALVAIFLLPAHIGGVDFSRARGIVAVILVIFVAVVAAIRYLRWRYVKYVLTNRRIILEAGFLSRNAESIELVRVQNTSIHRPLGDRVIGAGDIEIESAGRDGTELLHRVPRCEQFYAQLLQAVDSWRQGGAGVPGAAPVQPSGL